MGKRLVWLLLVLVGVGGLAYSFLPRPVFVEMVRAERKPLQVHVLEEGKTQLMDRFTISAPVTGFAHRLRLEVGDRVKRGAVLLHLAPQRSRVLDPRSRAEAAARIEAAEAAVQAARKDVGMAEADAALAETTRMRLEKLFNEGLSTQAALDEAEAKARRTRSALESARFSVRVAQFKRQEARMSLRFSDAATEEGKLPTVEIKSPVDGRVLKIIHESEGVVQEGQDLIEIGDPSALEVAVDVLSSDAVLIRPGMKVLFERWGGEGGLEGRVRLVEPRGFTKISALGVEEQRVMVISDIVTPGERWERLGDGFRVEARFILWEGEHVLQVPGNTLFRHEGAWAVFVVDGARARRRAVQLGRHNGMSAEVISGVAEGDMVISHPSDAVGDGRAVRWE
ncbi:MAG: efflux RND transporter periplasmic adaptor subunit [Nitrospiria bacterium]